MQVVPCLPLSGPFGDFRGHAVPRNCWTERTTRAMQDFILPPSLQAPFRPARIHDRYTFRIPVPGCVFSREPPPLQRGSLENLTPCPSVTTVQSPSMRLRHPLRGPRKLAACARNGVPRQGAGQETRSELLIEPATKRSGCRVKRFSEGERLEVGSARLRHCDGRNGQRITPPRIDPFPGFQIQSAETAAEWRKVEAPGSARHAAAWHRVPSRRHRKVRASRRNMLPETREFSRRPTFRDAESRRPDPGRGATGPSAPSGQAPPLNNRLQAASARARPSSVS